MEKAMEQTREKSPVRQLVLTALFAALGCAATLVLQIPSPTGGYLNLGDAVVILGAFLLGPVYGAAAGGLGPAMADLLSGYAAYVPATLVIKAVMALTAAGLFRAMRKKSWSLPLCAVAAEIPMIAGYWLFDALLLFLSTSNSVFSLCLAGSAAGIPGNLVQGIFGAAASTLLAAALRRSAYVRQAFSSFG
ncbi:MAG: ECF transporter S component [Oscillibacter sp.]|nr:ECF transporter S component [Oscillibacter sp.]